MSGGGDRLNLSARRDSWRSRAACAGKPTAWFFPPDQGHGGVTYRWQPPPEALALCARCPVIEQCAIAGDGEYGTWAGVFRAERQSRKFVEFRCERCGIPVTVRRLEKTQYRRCPECLWEDPETHRAATHKVARRRRELEQAVAGFESDIARLEAEVG